MGIVLLAIFVFAGVGIAAAAIGFVVAVLRNMEAHGRKGELPTVLNVGKKRVLGALDQGDLGGARAAFLNMTAACGSCSKMFRNPTLSA